MDNLDSRSLTSDEDGTGIWAFVEAVDDNLESEDTALSNSSFLFSGDLKSMCFILE